YTDFLYAPRMAEVTRHRKALVDRVLTGKGKASTESRRAAFDHAGPDAARDLLDKVAKHAYKVTDEEVVAAKQKVSQDEIFELVVCAAIGQATRQLEGALAAVASASPKGERENASDKGGK